MRSNIHGARLSRLAIGFDVTAQLRAPEIMLDERAAGLEADIVLPMFDCVTRGTETPRRIIGG